MISLKLCRFRYLYLAVTLHVVYLLSNLVEFSCSAKIKDEEVNIQKGPWTYTDTFCGARADEHGPFKETSSLINQLKYKFFTEHRTTESETKFLKTTTVTKPF